MVFFRQGTGKSAADCLFLSTIINERMKLRIIKDHSCRSFISQAGLAQRGRINWTEDGNAYTKIKDGGIVK